MYKKLGQNSPKESSDDKSPWSLEKSWGIEKADILKT